MSTATTEVRERPILFSGPMVRAILDGKKTQTRRVMNPQPWYGSRVPGGPHFKFKGERFDAIESSVGNWYAFAGLAQDRLAAYCPYGKAGGRLWVRESWGISGTGHGGSLSNYSHHVDVTYRADNEERCHEVDREIYRACDAKFMAEGGDDTVWRPSIHIPRWASRINLEIELCAVERLQEISEDDALAEGIRTFTKDGKLNKYWACDPIDDHPPKALRTTWQDMPHTAKEAYASLWDSINGVGAWDSNPWVWTVAFKVLAPGEAGTN